MLRCYEIYVMDVSYLLQLEIPTSTVSSSAMVDGPAGGLPLCKLLWAQMKAILLMCNVVVLTEHTAQIAPRKEHAARAIVTLYARLFTKMRSYGVYTGCRGQHSDYASHSVSLCEIHDVRAYQACPPLLEAIDST